MAWAINVQLGQTLPHLDCVMQRSWSGAATLFALAVAIGSVGWSVRAARHLSGTERFVAISGSGISSIVSFAVLLQGAATLVIDPCLR